jgi:hypothetical protein
MGAFKKNEEVKKSDEEKNEEAKGAEEKQAEGSGDEGSGDEGSGDEGSGDEGSGESAEAEVEKAINPAMLAGMLRGLEGAPKDAVDALIAWADSKKKKADAKKAEEEEEEVPMSAKKKTTKSEDGASPSVQIFDDGTVIVNGAPVVKGKTFTPSRTGAIKEVVGKLIKLMGEIGDADTLKALADMVKELPDGNPGQGIKAVGTTGGVALKKAEEEIAALKAELEKSKEERADVVKRLDEIEKTREPSKSVDGDGGTDKETVKKEFWGGVI